ncbi:DNA-binding transcriptional regulator GbsR (MarR family) [Deinobacterium chartae]|uniref:DNA-binding transcriptional regulator GbsR (MarR family) n=1 Tax=Deinobacterium chartae TaxID=521158 RepID=A0A841I1E4_9DEIO|nr:MarR family transcriptional regulator [Deinobacterium chartae]MBB6098896.1 DNA-binding transcriptional regulator GbsR (MarR family) [Deinobacterium chartae]
MLSPLDQILEEYGQFFENYGLPRIVGRVYGLLLTTDEPAVGLEALSDRLRISRASASTAVRQLHAARMIDKVTLPGDRRDYYRVAPDAHARYLRSGLEQMLRLSDLVRRARQLPELGPQAREKLARIEGLYDDLARTLEAFFAAHEAGR